MAETTQQMFTAAMQKLADERDLNLIVNRSYSNVGTYSFHEEGMFEPTLRVPFDFQGARADFSAHGTNLVLGRNDHGGCFAATEGAVFHVVLVRIAAILDGKRPQGETDNDRQLYQEAVERRERRRPSLR